MHALLQDLRFAFRQLIKNPGFTGIVVLILALGTGVNAGLFALVNGCLLRPLPVSDPQQIVVLPERQGGDALQVWFVSFPALQDFRQQAKESFSDIFADVSQLGGLSFNGQPNHFSFSLVTGNYFSALGIQPAVGRLFRPDEGETPGSAATVVLGYSFWQKKLGGDLNIVGKQVLIDGKPATVVGVVSKEFHGTNFALEMDGYVPLTMAAGSYFPANFRENRGLRRFNMMARLKPGVSLIQAQSAVDVITERLAKEYPATDKDMKVRVIPEREARPSPLSSNFFPVIARLLLVLAALLLLLTCMNVANLMLVRASVRTREMAIRAALGASRGRLMGQMLTESVLLAFLGGIAGMLLARWSIWAIPTIPFLRLETNLPLPVDLNLSFDGRVFSYLLLAVLLSGIFVGLWPALRAGASGDAALRDSGRTGLSAPGSNRLRRLLVVAQVAGSLMLLITSGLLLRSLERVQRTNLGFDPDNVLNLLLNTEEAGYDQPRSDEFYRDLKDRVRALPGVESASLACSVPMGNLPPCQGGPGYVEGRPLARGEQPAQVSGASIDPDYFQTMRVSLLRGRAFTDFDTDKTPKVAIVNQAMASRLWPAEDPIGKRFSTAGPGGPFWEVVGVAQDGKYIFISLNHQPYFYVADAQNHAPVRVLHVRTSGILPEALIPEVQEVVHSLAPDLPILDLKSMRRSLAGTNGYFLFRAVAFAAASMGILGLILAVVGVYGVVSYTSRQRTREIGIRLALGASRGNISRLVLRQGAVLVLAGIIAGLCVALGLTRIITNMLVETSATDPLTFISVTLLLAAVGLWACYVPARRAMAVDPIEALRCE
jgi:predicted permease